MPESDKKTFIFDDDAAMVALLQRIVQKKFSRIYTATSVQRALDLVEAEAGDFDIILTDMIFSDGSGLDILRAAKQKSALTAVAVFTAYASLETAILALHEGAFDYVAKPFSVEQILALLNKMDSYTDLQRENQELRRRLEEISSVFNNLKT